MASSSYYQLDNFPASTQAPQPYSGHGYDEPRPLRPPLSQAQTGIYYNQASHPDSYSKPLMTNTHAPTSPPSKLSSLGSRLKSQRFQRYKRYLRIGKTVSQVISFLFSSIMFAIMVFMTIKYQNTKDIFRAGRTAWPKHPKLWPTFMLLAASGVTLILSLVTILMYCCAFNKARRSWKLTIVRYVIHILGWIIISAIYRYEKSLHNVNNDLWGWTCSQEVDALQAEFGGVVNFDSLCRVQSSSWEVSLAEFAVKIAFAIGHFVIYRKTRDDEKQHLADGLGGAITDGLENAF